MRSPGRAALALLIASVTILAAATPPFMPWPVAVAATFAVVLLAATLRWPAVAVCAVLFLLYSNLPVVGVAFHGVPRPVASLFPLLLAVPLAHDLVVRRAPLVLTPAFALLVLLLAVQLAGVAFARDAPRALEHAATFALEGVLLYLLVVNAVRTRAILRGALWALVAAGLVMAVMPLFQQVTGTFGNTYGGLAQVEGGGFRTGRMMEQAGTEAVQARSSGTIGETNRYAQVMLVLLPLAVSRYFAAKRPAARLLALACAASIALGFALAFSRGGAVGAACMLAVGLALRLIPARAVVLFVGVLALVLAAVPQYWKRLETIGASAHVLEPHAARAVDDGAVRRRVTSMLAAGRVFLDHPLIGVGPGMFKAYSQEYGNQDALRRIESGRRAHSLYLEIAAENGAVGLTLFLAALAATVHGLAVARRACLGVDPELADVCGACLLGLTGYLATGLFLHLSYVRYFALLLALCGAAARIAMASSSVRRAATVMRPAAIGGAA